MTSPTQPSNGRSSAGLSLNYPMSLGLFDRYEDAQAAVDYLSDEEFPVQNCLIVGTDLRQVERVTGRLTTGRIVLGGALSGAWMGLFVGLVFTLFATPGDTLTTIAYSVGFGAIFGLVWAMLGYGMTRGRRDFTSVSKVVATRYELLTEHKFAQRARDLLDEMPPKRY